MEPLMHVIIPVLILIALRFDKNKIALLAIVGILPDMDYLIPGLPHRSLTHSLVFVLITVAITYLLARKAFKTSINDAKEYAIIVFVMLFSHIILDLMTGGTAILYPFMTQRVDPLLNVTINKADFSLSVNAALKLTNMTYTHSGESNLVSEQGLLFASLLGISLVAAKFRKH